MNWNPALSSNRRKFLKQASAAGMGAFSARVLVAQAMQMPMPGKTTKLQGGTPMLHSLELPSFVDEMPLPAKAFSTKGKSGEHVRIAMREIHTKVHRDVPPTRMWSYGPTGLAPLIEARSGEPLRVEWVNELPTEHFLPVDFSLHGCGRDVPEVRACVHMHGGKNPPSEDGYPEDWYVPGKSRINNYPIQQEAAALWYHDHAMGLNRLNVYAGLAGMMIIRDEAEEKLGLPSGKYELPITLYDRNFTKDGQLLYLDSGDPEHPWVSEFAGDAILANGKIRPYFHVEPRLYRIRLLNAANSRFFTLTFTDNQPFHQIGTDQGLLSAPAKRIGLSLAPAERADLLVDFSQHAGQNVHLRHGAQDILQFRVAPDAGGASKSVSLPVKFRPIERIPESEATVTRQVRLHDFADRNGNSMLMLLNLKHWHEPTTEFPKLGSTEIWEFINLTEDTHPMHLHLVRFQLVDRKPFDVFAYRNNKGMISTGPAMAPEENELGWKDVIQCPPGLVTRIIMKFEGYKGKYLYHCHILEHESNDMMRPFEVIA
jgi:spore coat protein A